MTAQDSRRRGSAEGTRAMAERIHQQALDRQDEWMLHVATAIEQHCGHPEILARLERRRRGGYQAA